MNISTISLEHTGRFNRLILDYVNGEENVKEFYSLAHAKENYKRQIESRKQFPINRNLLTDSLLKQYQTIGGAKFSVLSNIESLRKENTYTITTGHQLNIFTGPLYFIYKILHTIKLTEQLRETHPENDFVPIYWMNSEDHDLEEVGQFNLFGKKYTWQTEQTGATGRMKSESLTEFCSQLDEVFSNNYETRNMISIFRKAYKEFGNLATATRYFANEMFGQHGLVVIDSDDASLKNSFVEFFKTDIFDSKPYKLVHETNQRLESAGYHVQVNPRQINCFYLVDGIRNRIVETEKGFRVFQTDIRFTASELIAELEKNPDRFSPNVVLRPLFQEFILPNLTYVGGAGELAYWLQYKHYFKEMGVSFPLLSLRNHFLLIDSQTANKMDDLNLHAEDMFHSVDDLIKGHVLEVSDANISLDVELSLLAQLYSGLKIKATDIDGSLVASIEAEQARVQKAIEQWGSRFSRSLKKNNEVSVNRIDKIYRKLFPNGYLQERHDNFLEFYAKYGQQFFRDIHSATEPFATELRTLRFRKS
ncbi:MAG: bacillithiol biosynthesis cysteine-adding enzyme BshC [Flavobacteriales bacterium]|nr:bacillithiol biosynthesis cysteine-adding enzyme BshC [Flavobacteriales bacterium]